MVLNCCVAQEDGFTAASGQAELQRLQTAARTLDLAIEFGFDPIIVQVTEQLSRDVFRKRKCPSCPTWRWVDSDRKLTYMLLSIIQIESGGSARAYNPSGASGLTQLLYSTAVAYDKNLKREELFEIPKNLQISVAHFVDLLERYHGNEHLAILAWNRGIGSVARSIALGQSPENGYAIKVFEQAALRNAGELD